jgi:biotin carboxyl carrier protein
LVADHRLGPLTVATRRTILRYGDRDYPIDVLQDEQTEAEAVVAGETVRLTRDGQLVRSDGDRRGPAWAIADGPRRWVYYEGCVYVLVVPAAGRRRPSPTQASLTAPMPATVRQVRVAAGDRVSRGDTLLILEAMKMELPVRAEADGTVVAVHCREGEMVQPGRPLIDVGPPEGT